MSGKPARKLKASLRQRFFARFARVVEAEVGRPHTFGLAFFVVVAWAVSGPFFGWSDTWQLVINTGTTIVTFLMVFLIQNTQNRDSRALHMKLDELIVYTQGASNDLIELENLSDEQLDRIEEHFHALARRLGQGDLVEEPSARRRRHESSEPR